MLRNGKVVISEHHLNKKFILREEERKREMVLSRPGTQTSRKLSFSSYKYQFNEEKGKFMVQGNNLPTSASSKIRPIHSKKIPKRSINTARIHKFGNKRQKDDDLVGSLKVMN